MIRTVALWPAAAAVGLLTASAARADEPGSRVTRDFVRAAAQSDQFEILEAETVLAVSQDAQILSFARTMIEDHRRTSAALSNAATRSGLVPPEKGISDDQAHLLSALQSLAGKDFDKAYATQQALAHRSALALDQMYAASGDDPNVRSAASSAATLVQSHLTMADHLETGRQGG